MPSHYPVDASRTDLAREFKANPSGRTALSCSAS